MAHLDVSAESILGDRGLRYKRNTLAVSLITTVLYWTNAPLGDVSLFGVTLSNVENREAAAWLILLAILGYQWVMLTYYGWRDWCVWQQRIRDTFLLSPLNAAIWVAKGVTIWWEGVRGGMTIFETESVRAGLKWTARDPNVGTTVREILSSIDREHIQWRLLAFLTVEFGLPFLWGLVSLYLAASKALG